MKDELKWRPIEEDFESRLIDGMRRTWEETLLPGPQEHEEETK